jgi:hypothetical protein
MLFGLLLDGFPFSWWDDVGDFVYIGMDVISFIKRTDLFMLWTELFVVIFNI